MRRDIEKRLEQLQADVSSLVQQVTGQEGVSYRVTPAEPGDLSFTSEGDWATTEAQAAAPDPSDDGADLEALDRAFVFVPEGEDARNAKGNWQAPYRNGPDGPAHVDGLTALLEDIHAGTGFEAIGDETLRAGYEFVVDALVSAGHFDAPEDAPEFQGATASDPEDGGSDGGGQPDGGQASASGTDVFEDVDLTAQVQASVDPDKSTGVLAGLQEQLKADDHGGLVGVIWGAGDHDLGLGGEPTQVHVPEETVQPTFQALQEDVEAEEVEIGLDHAPDDSVLAQTGLREIAVAEDVALAANQRHIVLTESRFTAEAAEDAYAQGEFDDHDFSVVADVAVRTEDGERVRNDDGRLVLDAVRITRIDAVDNGAVDAASIGSVPELASHLQRAGQAADAGNPMAAAEALQASAEAITDFTNDMESNFDPDDLGDFEDLDAAEEQLQAAGQTIEELQTELDSLEAQATAFEEVAHAHGVDVDDYDDAAAAAQAVVDEQTAEQREAVAELEAELAAYDTGEDDIQARAEELAGQSRRQIEAALNERKAEKLDAVEAAQNKGRASASNDLNAGRDPDITGGSGGSDEADELAEAAMGGVDQIEWTDTDLSASEFLRQKYDVEAADYSDAGALNDAIAAEEAQGVN